MSNEQLALVVFCAVSGWLVAIIAVVAKYQHEKMSPDEFRNLMRCNGIDWLRLRMLLDPPALPQGGGARDPLCCGSGFVPGKYQRHSPSATLAPGHGRDVTP